MYKLPVVKCGQCEEILRPTRPKEFLQCNCENETMLDAGDEYYSRSGGKLMKHILFLNHETGEFEHMKGILP